MSDNTIFGKSRTDSEADEPDPAPTEAGRQEAEGVVPTVGRSESGLSEHPGDTNTAFQRARLYGLLALGFERPGEDLSAAFDDDAYCTDLVAAADALGEGVAEAAVGVGAHVTDPETLYDDWGPMFGVEEGHSVSPYELNYLPGPLVTNVRRLADINGFYKAFDLEAASDKNDRGDHICFQLEFLSHLCLREAHLREGGDDRGVRIVGDAQQQFIEDHLGRWFWRFTDEVSASGDGFYAALADALAALLESEIDRFGLDPEWVPDDPGVEEWSEGIFGESGRGCGGCGMNSDGSEIPTDQYDPTEELRGVDGGDGPDSVDGS
ncbi:dehydrogenase [Halovenus sp. WSH3]|uniref:Dehydrogenase n=1 Tax=Halovenus carboxidivorans TaxID=2692199 RepID=A0A6B0T0C0_9EURY|nr:molecular chaperone TorD family protein [Halovenus carboxidivorans]MXR51434.1 dehydrogenase [Halovenus carboxidivorans]